MNQTTPEVTPEKIHPFVKIASPDQLEALHLVSYHMIRHQAPAERCSDPKLFMELFAEGDSLQRMLIYQIAYHIIKRNRQ